MSTGSGRTWNVPAGTLALTASTGNLAGAGSISLSNGALLDVSGDYTLAVNTAATNSSIASDSVFTVGGGTQGNVAANTIQTIVDAPQLSLLAATVTNPSLATGGAARETIDHAVLHAPTVFRSLKRAVTGDAF